jgi:uncharacterized HAD superfamily protein
MSNPPKNRQHPPGSPAPEFQFRSISDLNALIRRAATRLPSDVDVIVGVPRSGLLAANLLALHLNLPLADVDSFLAGRTLAGGRRLQQQRAGEAVGFRRALVLDDSILSGAALREVRNRFAAQPPACPVLFGCVYATRAATAEVDIHFEICEAPRVFEWNLFHHATFLKRACLDIDGVLCRDPLPEENDDGPAYRRFLETAEPLHLPTVPVGSLVTCRLEKYRPETEAWLQRQGVRYDELIMWDLPSAADRRAAGGHGRFKAGVYQRSERMLFIESSRSQADVIVRETGKSVFCVETQTMLNADPVTRLRQAVRRAPRRWWRRLLARWFPGPAAAAFSEYMPPPSSLSL